MNTPKIYFLDFDRTLFDVDNFARLITTRPGFTDLEERTTAILEESKNGLRVPMEKRQALWKEFDTRIASGVRPVEPARLQSLVFPDTLSFLEKHGPHSIIVTTGFFSLQQMKVVGSGVAELVKDIVYLPMEALKGPAIRDLSLRSPGSFAFIDDTPFHLDSVAKDAPFVALYEMRRDGKSGCGRYPLVRNLLELP